CWDAVVVGAGPAGSVAARELARRGLKVILVDKATFPRHKVCGCCLNLAALAVLERVGLGELPARCGAFPLRRVRIAAHGREAMLPLPGGVSLSRRSLDAVLVRAAQEAGVVFLPGTQATPADAAADLRCIRLHQGQRKVSVFARLVLAANGLAGN